jgi:hypothetical protein
VPRRAWVAVVLTAALGWCASADAAQVSSTLTIKQVTPTTVSFSLTAKRVCNGEQCDYFSEIDQLADDAPCPQEQPADRWIAWTGNVQTTGPTTETGKITPRGWLAATPAPPTRLCVYTYADRVYYLTADAVVQQPAGGAGPDAPAAGGDDGTGGGATGGGTTGGGTGGNAIVVGATVPGGTGPVRARDVACRNFTYQQDAQKALKQNGSLAGRLDRNGNGVACENLEKLKSYVNTVAMRKAAIATRAALRKAYGAKFAQASGYRERCRRIARTRVRCSVAWEHAGRWTGYVDVAGLIRDNDRLVTTHVHVARPRA